ncbi:hypothetical protein CDAR_452261 [Caerostris darwini]|uniref:Uncharacterized protein n=1 Tax=Caerostris darwini TaxID=1538125 RepID=A0AAV4PTR1_9ARAC|nr:hypothetical protein CDAR_452261 [Caerostris darwini]
MRMYSFHDLKATGTLFAKCQKKFLLLAKLNSSCLSKQKGERDLCETKLAVFPLESAQTNIHRTVENSINAEEQKPSSSWAHSSEKATPNASKSK